MVGRVCASRSIFLVFRCAGGLRRKARTEWGLCGPRLGILAVLRELKESGRGRTMSDEASASGGEGGGTPMCVPSHPPTVSSISNTLGGVVSIVEFPKSHQAGLESSSAFASCEVIGGSAASVAGTLEIASAEDSRTHVPAAMDCSSDAGREDSVRLDGNRKRSAVEAINSGYSGKKPARDLAAAESSVKEGRILDSSRDKELNGTRRAEGGGRA